MGQVPERHPGRAAARRAARFRRRAGGRAADRRRLLRHLAGRLPERPGLRQAGAGAAAGQGRLARAGRAQRLRGGLDADRGRHRAGRGARAARTRTGPPVRWSWPISTAGALPAVEGGAARRARPSRPWRPAVGDRLGRIHAATARRPGHRRPVPDRRHLPRHPARALSARHRPRPIRACAGRCAGSRGAPPRPSSPWSMATSARRTSCSARTARCSSTPSAPGTAIPPSTSPSASTTCC